MDPATMAMVASSFMGDGGSNPLGAIGGGLGKSGSSSSAKGDFFAGDFSANFGGDKTMLYLVAGAVAVFGLQILLKRKRKRK